MCSLGSWIIYLTSFNTALSHKVLQHYHWLTARWVLKYGMPTLSEGCFQSPSKKSSTFLPQSLKLQKMHIECREVDKEG